MMSHRYSPVLWFAIALVLCACGSRDSLDSNSDSAGGSLASIGASDGLAGAADGDATGDACPAEERPFCTPCECDAQCGEGGVCVDDRNGAAFCSHACSVTLNDCEPGRWCGQYGPTVEHFACLPDGGSCESDGLYCSSCARDEDCDAGHICHKSGFTNAKNCYPVCERDEDCVDTEEPTECAKGKGICAPVVDGKARDICHWGRRGICEPCMYLFDCAPGLLCAGGYCTAECRAFSNMSSTCPDGLFCIDGLCAPSNAHKCQGWLSCPKGCAFDETCDHGSCVTTCVEAECPDGHACQNGACEVT